MNKEPKQLTKQACKAGSKEPQVLRYFAPCQVWTDDSGMTQQNHHGPGLTRAYWNEQRLYATQDPAHAARLDCNVLMSFPCGVIPYTCLQQTVCMYCFPHGLQVNLCSN